MAQCKDCEQEIVWATSESNGRNSCFDAKPTPTGRFVIIKGKFRPVASVDLKLLRDRFDEHWTTCPDRQAR